MFVIAIGCNIILTHFCAQYSGGGRGKGRRGSVQMLCKAV